jgi:ketosteroid isomerase-like protein
MESSTLALRDTAWAMSQENVELVRSLYRAADPSRFFDLLDEEVELDFSAYPVPGSAVLRGKDAAIDWSRRWWGTWDEYVLDAAEIVDAGEGQVVVVERERRRGKGSGAPLERRWPSSSRFGWGRWSGSRPSRPVRRPSKPPSCGDSFRHP